MRTVTQHNAAQIAGGRRRKNLTAESPRIQERQKTRMVYMRVGQEHIIYQRFLHRQFAVLKHIRSLLHTVVHQNILIAYPQIMAAPCHLMVCPDKHKLHTVPPLLSAVRTRKAFGFPRSRTSLSSASVRAKQTPLALSAPMHS